ncbi:nucleotidyltransferase domain-containing protein [Microbaculum marinum]|uniref:Nucleotidyltransferase domain-containing protein n=1 Tax=Microbaculum marinum TaxID=1764581 RepID=A0AAW9RIJ5_9HYPH
MTGDVPTPVQIPQLDCWNLPLRPYTEFQQLPQKAISMVEMIEFQELNNDQRREAANTEQRFVVFTEARKRADGYRGSMVFSGTNGHEYLLRSYYDPRSGVRRQKSLGPRSAETERLKAEYDSGRAAAKDRLAAAREAIERQAAMNRALGLGRVPDPGGRIIRALDSAGLLGNGMRVVGTNALYAYEAVAGVRFSSEVTTTDDIDILFDTRATLRFEVSEEIGERTLMGLLRRVDRSFERTSQPFQASNRDGYLVDLIRPMRNPPWTDERDSLSGTADDIQAVEILGLVWQESAPSFSATAIDVRGFPVRIVAPDPRAFAVHKLWLSQRDDRNPGKRERDLAQAKAVAQLTAQYLRHLPFQPEALKNFPKAIVDRAAPLFDHAPPPEDRFDY